MNNITKGLGWAGAMLFIACGAWSGIMDREAAETVLLVLPILAVSSFRNGNTCRLWSRS